MGRHSARHARSRPACPPTHPPVSSSMARQPTLQMSLAVVTLFSSTTFSAWVGQQSGQSGRGSRANKQQRWRPWQQAAAWGWWAGRRQHAPHCPSSRPTSGAIQ